jgi:Transglycosylase SLT domain
MPVIATTRTLPQAWKPARIRRDGRARLRLAAGLAVAVAVFFAVNWAYHVVRKPTELFAPVSPVLAKSPRATWAAYGSLFRAYSTDVVSAELLAALAQVEGQGNPVARTYWRWQWSLNPFELYRPASSAVGMFQITDATFREATRYCIRNHAVIADGPWYEPTSCWFNSLYTRVIPSHAAELTAAYLHRSVVDVLARQRVGRAGPDQKQSLAALIHLCGTRRGEAFVRRGFQAAPGERCGDHDVRRYLARVGLLKREFARLNAAG